MRKLTTKCSHKSSSTNAQYVWPSKNSLDDKKSKHAGLAYQNDFGSTFCGPAKTLNMTKSQNMLVWLRKMILAQQFVAQQKLFR